ncbi:uncharacterized protein BT62DRAFT_979501 [Guyanagaster necrorhizus]|uniref:Transmembrane protein n=1 Tax=Guyanagaster necrorhizus TaxID=856835 RepID=A0A9P7VXC4_9AGAR|nr:uncharacterized protein BT62DRAFT_979501 [Guyanagaster necrorhizus MCA 3950]KAG7448465.1 hypothetical protein BT62DRAFT_979501 [Guyanagaster necrorhizus MCA 3950]
MPDWSSQSEISLDNNAFIKLMHALLGVYVWEYFVSISFDWDFMSGRKKFRWPMIFYFLNRYLLLFALIGMEVNCQALYTFNQLAGNAAVGLASINLSLRTIAVYAQSKFIIGLLILLILGHWSLILQGVLIKADWIPETDTCAITSAKNTILAATFIYSMVFDFVILSLNTYKLVGRRGPSGGSQLTRMLFSDGLVYFIIAFLSNLIATVFMCLNLNAIMSVIFNVPAAIGSTIVACRAVRRLNKFYHRGAEVYASGSGSNSNDAPPRFRTMNPVAVGGRTVRGTSAIRTPPSDLTSGVHVQMETFTRTDNFNNGSVSPTHVTFQEDSTDKRGSVIVDDLEFGDSESKHEEL